MTEEARKARNAYQREYRRKNKEKLAAYNKEWNQRHPEKRKEYAERFWERRAAEMDQGSEQDSVLTVEELSKSRGSRDTPMLRNATMPEQKR